MAEKWQKVDHALLFEVKQDHAVARTPAKRKIIDPHGAGPRRTLPHDGQLDA
jgi:hypothetical protein